MAKTLKDRLMEEGVAERIFVHEGTREAYQVIGLDNSAPGGDVGNDIRIEAVYFKKSPSSVFLILRERFADQEAPAGTKLPSYRGRYIRPLTVSQK